MYYSFASFLQRSDFTACFLSLLLIITKIHVIKTVLAIFLKIQRKFATTWMNFTEFLKYLNLLRKKNRP